MVNRAEQAVSEAVPSDPDHLGSRTARCQCSAAGPSTSRDRETDGLEPEFRDASPIPPDNIQGVRGCVYAGSEDLCPRPISPTCQRSQAVIPRVNDQTSGEIRPANRPGRAEASGRRTAPRAGIGPGIPPYTSRGPRSTAVFSRLSQQYQGPLSADVGCHCSRLRNPSLPVRLRPVPLSAPVPFDPRWMSWSSRGAAAW